MFNEPELKDEDNPEKLNVIKLICLGLMLCGGTYDLKARVFYDVVQDNMQQKISSSDKDFMIAFTTMVELVCYMIPRQYRNESGAPFMTGHYPEPGSLKFRNTVEELKEIFLDEVFGEESNLKRGDFLLKMSQKSKWLFESEDVRARWAKLCEEYKEE